MVTSFILFVLLAYVYLISELILGIRKKNPLTHSTVENHKELSFSILIPFRNEAENLNDILQSIANQNYDRDKFEIILVNDHSTDGYKALINTFITENPTIQMQLINREANSLSPKKDAIQTGLKYSTYDWIITTDADCIVPTNWLAIYNTTRKIHNPNMMIGSVLFKEKNSFINLFQYLDLLSLQGVTLGSFNNNKGFMCNGANMAYSKAYFYALKGFEGNEKYSSGDDVFLLQKAIVESPEKVHYISDSYHLVSTKNEKTWQDIIEQRVRWASKTKGYTSNYAKILAVVVLATNLIYVFGPLGLQVQKIIAWLIITKLIIDIIFIRITCNLYHQKISITKVIYCSLLYPYFNTIVGIFALIGNFKWKERELN